MKRSKKSKQKLLEKKQEQNQILKLKATAQPLEYSKEEYFEALKWQLNSPRAIAKREAKAEAHAEQKLDLSIQNLASKWHKR